MENVGDKVLQAFALNQFLHYGMGSNLLTSTEGPPVFKSINEFADMSPDDRLAFCESYAWLRTGMDVGYFPFSEPYSRDEQQTWSNVIRKSKSTWSSEFYDLIVGFLAKEYFLIVQDEQAQFPAQDSFQAALLAHQSFDQPLLEPLLRELRTPETSILDEEHKRLDLTQLYEAFDTLPEKPTIESLAAGFMRLSNTMQMFTDLFPFEEHPAPPYGAEFTLYDALGALACSRLDLFDKKAADRFMRLRDLFFQTLERVRRQALLVAWSQPATVDNFNMLLGRWLVFSGARKFQPHPDPSDPFSLRTRKGVLLYDLDLNEWKISEERKIY
jgi:hypothetical protein